MEQRAYTIGVHMDRPGIQARIEYDQALNPRVVTLTALDDGPNVTARLIRDYPIGAVDAAAALPHGLVVAPITTEVDRMQHAPRIQFRPRC